MTENSSGSYAKLIRGYKASKKSINATLEVQLRVYIHLRKVKYTEIVMMMMMMTTAVRIYVFFVIIVFSLTF